MHPSLIPLSRDALELWFGMRLAGSEAVVALAILTNDERAARALDELYAAGLVRRDERGGVWINNLKDG